MSSSSSSSRIFVSMQEQTHAVIDLETLDTASSAVVISIGLAYGKNGAYTSTQWNLEAATQLLAGRTICQDTLAWWNKQPQATQQLAVENCIPVAAALTDLANILNSFQTAGGSYLSIWGNSPSFDLSILSSLYKQYNIQVPWKYYQERDLRTFGACVGVAFTDWEAPRHSAVAIPHYAKHDASRELEFIFAHYDLCQS